MLTFLSIQNYTIVASMELDFAKGMSAFTGETGAGKSIMIDALMLALGERADSKVIRPGAERCDIQASFSYLSQSEPELWLQEHDIPQRDEQIILRRIVTIDGRSKATINGIIFPLQKIKELSEMLIHIHGQHQHQHLLHHATHRQQLDQFANHALKKQALTALYQTYRHAKEACEALTQISAQEIEALSIQVQELQALNPKDNEMLTLSHEHELLHHAKDYIEQTQSLLEFLQADEGPSIRQQLHKMLQILSALPLEQPQIQSTQALLSQALILCEEASDDLETFGQSISIDPQRLAEVESRMGALHHLGRKYQIDVNQLPQHIQELEQKLAAHQDFEKHQAQLEKTQLEALQAYQQAAQALSVSRKKHAKRLEELVTANIQQLGMPHGRLEIAITPLETLHPHGCDKVEYKVSLNPGMKSDLLSKIASGGELSRINLAIQIIAAQEEMNPSLFFDEVDVGIGGATAAIVGQKLRELGQRLQVFCVTHQPQVAASAHQHFLVKKYIKNNQTFSSITLLTGEGKIEELARMLGGLTITSQTRSHAKELLETLS